MTAKPARPLTDGVLSEHSMSTNEERYLARAIARHAPAVAKTARAGLRKLRARFPGARQLVFDRRQSLPIGFAPAERGGAVFSLVLYPRWVRFFFLEGAILDDPEGRLEGSGNQVRSIRVDDDAAVLDDPYIVGLIAQALREADVDLTRGQGQVVLKSTLAAPPKRSSNPAWQPRATRLRTKPARRTIKGR